MAAALGDALDEFSVFVLEGVDDDFACVVFALQTFVVGLGKKEHLVKYFASQALEVFEVGPLGALSLEGSILIHEVDYLLVGAGERVFLPHHVFQF